MTHHNPLLDPVWLTLAVSVVALVASFKSELARAYRAIAHTVRARHAERHRLDGLVRKYPQHYGDERPDWVYLSPGERGHTGERSDAGEWYGPPE